MPNRQINCTGFSARRASPEAPPAMMEQRWCDAFQASAGFPMCAGRLARELVGENLIFSTQVARMPLFWPFTPLDGPLNRLDGVEFHAHLLFHREEVRNCTRTRHFVMLSPITLKRLNISSTLSMSTIFSERNLRIHIHKVISLAAVQVRPKDRRLSSLQRFDA